MLDNSLWSLDLFPFYHSLSLPHIPQWLLSYLPSSFPPQGLCTGLKLPPLDLCGIAPSCHSKISLNVTSSVRPTLATFETPPLLASQPDPCSLAPYLLPSHHSSQVIIIFLVFLFIYLHSCFSHLECNPWGHRPLLLWPLLCSQLLEPWPTQVFMN